MRRPRGYTSLRALSTPPTDDAQRGLIPAAIETGFPVTQSGACSIQLTRRDRIVCYNWSSSFNVLLLIPCILNQE